MVEAPYLSQNVGCGNKIWPIVAYRLVARKICPCRSLYASQQVCYTARLASHRTVSWLSGIGTLRRQIVFNKRLHNGVHAGVGLEPELQGPR